MRVRFWGTRGSIATPGPSTLRYGGNTSCVELVTNAGWRFIFDCGTGIRPLGIEMMQKLTPPIKATILLGHTHWDHIQGFPFFMPVFEPGNKFTVVAPEGKGRSLADVLAGQMEFTYFPVELDQLPARIEFRELGEGTYDFGGAKLITQFINHPAPCLGYRIEADGVIVVYQCDHEPFSETLWKEGAAPGRVESILHEGDRRHANFMRHADLVIHDAQYTPEEYATSKRNWGHSTYEYAVELAAMSDVRQLALTHHDPTHDDNMIAEIERRARNLARRRNFLMHVFCAYEGLEMGIMGPDTDRIRTIDLDPAAPSVMRPMKVLVVDDDPNLRLLAGAALKRDGYVVVEAGDGIEGLKKYADEKPDVIVLDLDMPRLNGIETLKKLRSAGSSAKDVPVLILTAHGDEGNTRAGFEAGATDYLAKPFTPPQLSSRVRACLSRSAAAVGAR